MKTRILSLALLAAALSGCTLEDESSVQWVAVCASAAPTATGCTYSATCDQTLMGTMWGDLNAVAVIQAPIEIANQLPSNADLSAGRLNTNIAYIQAFRMTPELPGGLLLPEETVDANVTVPTNSTTVAMVPVVPLNTATNLKAGLGLATSGHILMNVRAVGRFADNRTFVTGPLKVPVNFCLGCYAAPLTCTLPAVLRACPQLGQVSTPGCVTP